MRLTEDGVRLADQCKAIIKPLIDEFFTPLGEEKRELARMLRVLNSAQESACSIKRKTLEPA